MCFCCLRARDLVAFSISLFILADRHFLVNGSCCLKCFIGPSPDKYAIRFIPRENGVHTIDVKFNGTHIPGSPFQVRVGEPGQGGDAGLVTAYGTGLERGTTGNIYAFIFGYLSFYLAFSVYLLFMPVCAVFLCWWIANITHARLGSSC